MLFVIVGFKTTEKKAIYYTTRITFEGMGSAVRKAFEAGSHFVSIRRVK